jgi:hypothetical protein
MKWLKYKFDIFLRLNDLKSYAVKKINTLFTLDFDIYAIFGRCGPRNFPCMLPCFVSGSCWKPQLSSRVKILFSHSSFSSIRYKISAQVSSSEAIGLYEVLVHHLRTNILNLQNQLYIPSAGIQFLCTHSDDKTSIFLRQGSHICDIFIRQYFGWILLPSMNKSFKLIPCSKYLPPISVTRYPNTASAKAKHLCTR